MDIASEILDEIRERREQYEGLRFRKNEANMLRVFSDLSQIHAASPQLYAISAGVPFAFFQTPACLFLVSEKTLRLELAARAGDWGGQGPSWEDLPEMGNSPTIATDRLVVPLRVGTAQAGLLPFPVENGTIGALLIAQASDMDEREQKFFGNYGERVSFAVYNAILARKNLEHLRFIKALVTDIEHNVIVPNMIYKLFLKNLKGLYRKSNHLESLLAGRKTPGEAPTDAQVLAELADINRGFSLEVRNLESHHHSMSLFLETLFRRSHFDEGRLSLRAKPCNMKNDVVLPQLERYADKLEARGIQIDDKLSHLPEHEVISVVDRGLLAQVYANLFSNAIKYAQETIDEHGKKNKALSYGRAVITDYFGPGQDGIKYNVFTTGAHLSDHEIQRLFEEGYRGDNVGSRPGMGHGLAFVKSAIEIHDGTVGCEPVPGGNNFYFILPR